MALGLVGEKAGMTRVFTQEGASVPVTVIKVEKNCVTQLKAVENGHGYFGIQLGARSCAAHRLNRPKTGHLAAANSGPLSVLSEFRVSQEELAKYAVGQWIAADFFESGQSVDVISTSKGKGFAGTVKRWNFSMQDATHGNSVSHRKPGSIGQCQDPGRVFKGKKMAGRMGGKRCTVQNLQIVRVDVDNAYILVKGAVPGAKGSVLFIKPSVKSKPKMMGGQV